jgi:hypothetical protein
MGVLGKPWEVCMQLNFYNIKIQWIDSVKSIQDLELFFYDRNTLERKTVSETNFDELKEIAQSNPSSCYFQLKYQDLNKITDHDLVFNIASDHRMVLQYIDRFNDRVMKYQGYYQERWQHILILRKAMSEDNFLPLANLIQADLAMLEQNISTFATTISDLLEKILRRDSILTRSLCFSYCLFHKLGYQDLALLYDLLGATMLKDLGLTQNPHDKTYEKNEIYHKHTYYTLFLLKKIPFDLSPNCKLLIADHHEAQDGTGFPRGKKGDFYHPLCDVLKVSELIFTTNESKNYFKVAQELLSHSKRSSLHPSLISVLQIILMKQP